MIDRDNNARETKTAKEDMDNGQEQAEEIDPKTGKKKKEKKKKTVGQEIVSWVVTLLLAVIIAMSIRALLFEPIKVDGESMINTLQNGEIVLVTKPDVLMNKLSRGDVVICRFPNRNKATTFRLGAPLDIAIVGHELFVKRLVALPGDSVAVMDGKLYVNDAPVEEDYIDYPGHADYPRRVLGEDEYMVMGDNRASSHDSRSRDVGPISRDMIVGHAAYVLFPLNRMRTIR
ncbi:MAG: signal peptidase I [Christensenellales bacterium]|jgi:signal peptidase I